MDFALRDCIVRSEIEQNYLTVVAAGPLLAKARGPRERDTFLAAPSTASFAAFATRNFRTVLCGNLDFLVRPGIATHAGFPLLLYKFPKPGKRTPLSSPPGSEISKSQHKNL